jgi:hypothetical protein
MIVTTVAADLVMMAIVVVYVAAQRIRRPVPAERLRVRDTLAHPLPTTAPSPRVRVTGAQPALVRSYARRIPGD